MPDTVLGDVTRLRQVLFNLLSNAVKFTDSGGVFLSVRLGKERVVDDDGATRGGRRTVAGGFVSRCATPGSASPRATSNGSSRRSPRWRRRPPAATAALGLGLAISRRLCELMDGTLWVESEPGLGSTFHVAVPLEVVAGTVQPHRRPEQPRLAGRRVLVRRRRRRQSGHGHRLRPELGHGAPGHGIAGRGAGLAAGGATPSTPPSSTSPPTTPWGGPPPRSCGARGAIHPCRSWR